MRYANEIKVGIVFLIGVAVCIFGYFYLRGLGLGADKYYVRLNEPAQITQGNEVRLKGVKIGQISEVGFDPDTQNPVLTIEVRRSNPVFRLLRSYRYTIQSSSLVGATYLDIRGAYSPQDPVYQPNDPSQIIPAKASGGLLGAASSEETARQLTQTLANFNITLDRLNKGVLNYQNQQKLSATLDGVTRLTNDTAKLTVAAAKSFGPQGFRFGLGDPRGQRSLQQTLANAEVASANAARAAHNIEVASRGFGGLSKGGQQIIGDVRSNINGLFSDNRKQLNVLVGNLNTASANVAGLTETLSYVLKAGGFKENSQLVFQNLRRASENIEVATAGLKNLASDPTMSQNLTGTLTALRESAEALRDTASGLKGALGDSPDGTKRGLFTSLNASASNLEKVSAGLSGLVGDPALQTNVKGAAENLAGTLAATRSAAERVNSLLGGKKPKQTADPEGAGATGVSSTPTAFSTTGATFTARQLFDKGKGPNGARTFGDLGFETELLGAPFRLGLDGVGETNNITAQTGQYLRPDVALRYGVYRSKLGAGVELRRGRFALEGNVYDPNHASFNLYGGYNLTPNLQLRAGTESFDGRSTGSIGLRFTP
ncbi:MCE family protein [bacterium]|nr:MAG: MCE family protein [bacterium]